jgi:hypothetical protein
VNAIDEELISRVEKVLVNSITPPLITETNYSKYNITISIPLKSSEQSLQKHLCFDILQSNKEKHGTG